MFISGIKVTVSCSPKLEASSSEVSCLRSKSSLAELSCRASGRGIPGSLWPSAVRMTVSWGVIEAAKAAAHPPEGSLESPSRAERFSNDVLCRDGEGLEDECENGEREDIVKCFPNETKSK